MPRDRNSRRGPPRARSPPSAGETPRFRKRDSGTETARPARRRRPRASRNARAWGTCHRRRVSRIRGPAYRGRAQWPRQRQEARDRRVACQGEDDRRIPGPRLRRRVLDRPHPGPADECVGDPGPVKDEPWARLGVNVDEDFEPVYVVDARKKKVVADLKAKLRSADELLLATDEDREGEAIAWHLVQELKPTVPVRRMVFHEITRPAIERALARDARDRRVARRRPGGAPHPRPALRLRGLAGALAQSHARPVGRPRPVGRDTARRRARARADRIRRGRLLGRRRHLRSGRVHRPPRLPRRSAGRAGSRLRPGRQAARRRRGLTRGGRGARARRRRSRARRSSSRRSRRSRIAAAPPRRS